MNARIRFMLAGDNLMPETQLRYLGFTYSGFIKGKIKKRIKKRIKDKGENKKKEGIKKFKETRDLKYISQNKLEEACFQHCISYGACKNLEEKLLDKCMIRNVQLIVIHSMMDISKN